MVIMLLKEKRLEKNLSIAELSEKCGLSKGFLSEVENNLKIPGLEALNQIASALNCRPCDLYKYKK